jgi:hypothetical protein
MRKTRAAARASPRSLLLPCAAAGSAGGWAVSIQLENALGAFETLPHAVLYRGESGKLWITLPYAGNLTDLDGKTWRLNGVLTDHVHGLRLEYGTLTLAVRPRT